MRWLVGLLMVTAVFVGCIGDSGEDLGAADAAAASPSYEDLEAPNADEVLDEGPVRTFVFEGTTETSVSIPLFGSPTGERFLDEAFDVEGTVGYVEVTLSFDPDQGDLHAFLVDHEERVQCGASTIGVPKVCTSPVPNTTGAVQWRATVGPGFGGVHDPMDFRLEVALHPPSHIPWGDPVSGVDPSIGFRVADTGSDGAEPTAGVLSDGTIFVIEGTDVMRSTDDGRTWENVAPPGNDRFSLDPMLHVDEHTDTLYVDHLYVACSALSISEDAGETWITNPAACGAPANDHQKLAVGPNPTGAPANAVYYAYSSFAEGAWVSRSLDGGVTWTTSPVTLDEPYRNTGPVEADRDGTVFVPYYLCDGALGVGVSTDYAATFDFRRVADEPIRCDGTHRTDADPGPAVDAAGNLYVGYRTDEAIRFTYSSDKGETWAEPMTVNPGGLSSFTHVDAVAGDEGRLAIAYRATPDSDKGPNGDGWARWNVYVTFVLNATSEDPEVRTGIVHDPDDPSQRGPICSMGAACAGGSRNLLDFIDVVAGPDGRTFVAYADGCDAPCPTPADSRERLGLVGILEEGPRLFEEGAPWASGSSGATAGSAVPGEPGVGR